jgi:hypothetical protein
MNIKEFKEQTKSLDPKTRVMVSCFTLDYTKSNPEVAEAFDLSPDGSMTYGSSVDPCDAPSLEDFYKLTDDVTISIDVEDGFIFHALEQILYFSNKIVLIPR